MRKGEQTRLAVLEHALSCATRVGLRGLSIGQLATELSLSKSGLFAHFQSKEALQLQVLELATERFIEQVVRPALRAPRGEPRVRALLDRWLEWGTSSAYEGGCMFVTAAIELDDQPGAPRDFVVRAQRDWLDTLSGAIRIAVSEGHFRADTDPDQLAFEMYGLLLVFHQFSRLFRDPSAETRLRTSLSNLLTRVRAARSVP